MVSSPSAIHRTGPVPAASDYSTTLLQALTSDELQIGSVSRVQLLLSTLVERVHDAIYVLPRHARDPSSGVQPDPDEYARDVAMALKGIEKYCQGLPDDENRNIEQAIEELNGKIVELRIKNEEMLNRAKEVQVQLDIRL